MNHFHGAKVGGFSVGSKYYSGFLVFGSDKRGNVRQARMGVQESVVPRGKFNTNYHELT